MMLWAMDLTAAALPAERAARPRPAHNPNVSYQVPLNHLFARSCTENPSQVIENIRGVGRGCHWVGYGPGASLTEQTGSIPDTVQRSKRHVERRHALESEQCDGREGTVCAGV